MVRRFSRQEAQLPPNRRFLRIETNELFHWSPVAGSCDSNAALFLYPLGVDE